MVTRPVPPSADVAVWVSRSASLKRKKAVGTFVCWSQSPHRCGVKYSVFRLTVKRRAKNIMSRVVTMLIGILAGWDPPHGRSLCPVWRAHTQMGEACASRGRRSCRVVVVKLTLRIMCSFRPAGRSID